MRTIRHYLNAPLAIGNDVQLDELASAHLLKVLRLGVGDGCVLFNGDGHDYAAELVSAEKRGARARILSKQAVNNESPLRITLVQSIARGEKMDWIVQKACELGVHAIAPVITARTEVRLDEDRGHKRLKHWQGVVIAACEQSGRARLPEVAAPSLLATHLAQATPSPRYFLDPDATQTLAALALPADARLQIIIGPEGGLAEQDIAQLRAAHAVGVRIGPRILRTETAGLATIAALQSLFGDWK